MGGGVFEQTTDSSHTPIYHVTWSPVPLEPSLGGTVARPGSMLSIVSESHAIIDLDGDGYLDAVTSALNDVAAPRGFWYLFRGDGAGNFVGDSNAHPFLWKIPPAAPTAGGDVGNFTTPDMFYSGGRATLTDMNSDGLVDLVWKAGETVPKVFFNTGTGFRNVAASAPTLSDSSWISYAVIEAIDQPSTDEEDEDHITGFYRAIRHTRTVPVDLDGDGRIDLVDSGHDVTPITTQIRHTDGGGHVFASTPISGTGTDDLTPGITWVERDTRSG
jgi:hypothetical protein